LFATAFSAVCEGEEAEAEEEEAVVNSLILVCTVCGRQAMGSAARNLES
jgi:hypothetical protein